MGIVRLNSIFLVDLTGKPGKRPWWRKSLEASKQAQTRVWFSASDLFQPLWVHASWTRSIEEIWNPKSCRSNFWERRRRRKSGSFQLELSWYLGVFFPFRNLAQLLLLFWVSKLSAWVLCILLGWHLCLCVSVLCLGEGVFLWFNLVCFPSSRKMDETDTLSSVLRFRVPYLGLRGPVFCVVACSIGTLFWRIWCRGNEPVLWMLMLSLLVWFFLHLFFPPYRSVKKLRSGLGKFSYLCSSWFAFVLKDFPLGCSLLFLWIFLRFAFFCSCLRKWPGECCSWVRKEDDLIDFFLLFGIL